MKALRLSPSTRSVAVEEIPIPVPGPGEVLIKVNAVSLNPGDEFYISSPISAAFKSNNLIKLKQSSKQMTNIQGGKQANRGSS
jgi:NADPH:quinone reductase-like Zn-dependent oxidoreductase